MLVINLMTHETSPGLTTTRPYRHLCLNPVLPLLPLPPPCLNSPFLHLSLRLPHTRDGSGGTRWRRRQESVGRVNTATGVGEKILI